MEPIFMENRPILPKNLTMIIAGVLLATLAFMILSESLMDVSMPSWVMPVSALLFIVVIAVAFSIRMNVAVTQSGVEISYAFKKVTISADEVIDVRSGELGDIRNYANWNLKGVKHRAYSCIGDDFGVALKLLGKRVVVLSTSEPEEAFAAISSIRKE